MTPSLADYDFILPQALIAQRPAEPRDHARLLIYDRSTKTLSDDYFYSLEKYLPADTTIVLNNSKVEKCRLRFGAIEVFVVEVVNPTTVRAMVRPGRRFTIGKTVVLDQDKNISATVQSIESDGLRILSLSEPLDSSAFDDARLTPLPPYIAQDESLSDEYQTVYAKPLGSKAAPTAGLHFTEQQLERLRRKHTISEVTLHVGLGTFAPVKDDDIRNHHMHSEWFTLSEKSATEINAATHITAVGTTTVRTLESAGTQQNKIIAQSNDTEIFITPGYSFRHVDALITNFHLPKSTLLMLVAAFMGGTEELHRVYKYAIEKNYRFYSFGDAMLIL